MAVFNGGWCLICGDQDSGSNGTNEKWLALDFVGQAGFRCVSVLRVQGGMGARARSVGGGGKGGV
eukprot:8597402-Prorocentrum_lima.AAC.1